MALFSSDATGRYLDRKKQPVIGPKIDLHSPAQVPGTQLFTCFTVVCVLQILIRPKIPGKKKQNKTKTKRF